ncbi:hypothetical protein PAXRUDRAFT_137345, partial [Paxillus rubicundulus Ve08.2h10]
LILLDHFADHSPGLFQKRLRVDPNIFDGILDQINEHPIFSSALLNFPLPFSL